MLACDFFTVETLWLGERQRTLRAVKSGATSCSSRRSKHSSPASASSSPASRSTAQKQSPPGSSSMWSTALNRSWAQACCGLRVQLATSRASGCWRQSANTPSNAWQSGRRGAPGTSRCVRTLRRRFADQLLCACPPRRRRAHCPPPQGARWPPEREESLNRATHAPGDDGQRRSRPIREAELQTSSRSAAPPESGRRTPTASLTCSDPNQPGRR
jgi:hypothetical protein